MRSRGIEVELETRWENGLPGHVGFSLLDTEEEDTNRRVPNAPQQLVTAGVSFSVYNLLDDDREVPGGAEHIQDRIPLDGRSYRLQASYRF